MDKNNRFNPIIWDLNENFGVFDHLLYIPPEALNIRELDPFVNIDANNYPIVKNILSVEEYRMKYIAHYKTIIKEIFESGYYYKRGTELKSFIYNDVLLDTNRLFPFVDFEHNLDTTIDRGCMHIVDIYELMEATINRIFDV